MTREALIYKMKVQIKGSFFQIKIFIDEILHLSFYKEDFIGIQSWIEGTLQEFKIYKIEYSFKTTTIVSEYDSIEKWRAVLLELAKI